MSGEEPAAQASLLSTNAKLCLPVATGWGMVRSRWITKIHGEEAAERSGSAVSPWASEGKDSHGMSPYSTIRARFGRFASCSSATLDRGGAGCADFVGQEARGGGARGGHERSVTVSGLSVPLLGGVELTGLCFGSPQSADDPWLKAKKVRLGMSICQLMAGKFETSSIDIEGSELRIKRRGDGSLELADFILPPPREAKPSHHPEAESERINIQFHEASVLVIDEPSHSKLHLEKVEGDASREGSRIVVHNMRGVLNGGPFRIHRTARPLRIRADARSEISSAEGGSRRRHASASLCGSGAVRLDAGPEGTG